MIKKKLNKYKNKLDINYIDNNLYRKSGHGFSLLKFFENQEINKSVLIIHGDLYFDKKILKMVINSQYEDLVSVDRFFKQFTNDEMVVIGTKQVQNIVKINQIKNNLIGEIVGINKWSKDFQKKYIKFAKKLFEKEGIKFNWESVVNKMLLSNNKLKLNYLDIKKNKWININYKENYKNEKKIAKNLKKT